MAEPGFLRRAKNPTTIGMMMKITETHIRAIASGMAIGSTDSTPFIVVVMGVPERPITPHTQDERARQPQHSAVTTVIAIATVRFSIYSSSWIYVSVYNKKQPDVHSF
jgi:hypothetical protein